MGSRRSNYDLAYGDDFYERRGGGGGGGRWDRERFERERARSRGPPGRESFRFEESDRIGPRSSRLDVEFDERSSGRPRPRSAVYGERESFLEDDRRRSRPGFFEEDERIRVSSGGRDLAPYKNRYEDPLPPRRVERVVPRFEEERSRGGDDNIKIDLRVGGDDKRDQRRDDRREDIRVDERFSDRRGDRREDFRIDERFSDDRRRDDRYDDRRGDRKVDIHIDDRHDDRYGPPRGYYEDRQVYRPPPPPIEPDWRDYEDYRDAKIIRERTIDRRAPSRPRSVYEERDSFEEVTEEVKEKEKRPPGTKKGRTRMPKRLVHRRALLEMGWPFDDEEDFYVVRLALSKEHIDECIKISEHYKEEESKSAFSRGTALRVLTSQKKETVYHYDKTETKAIEAPPPAPEPPAPAETEVVETVTRKIIENPTDEDLERIRQNNEEREERESFHEEVRESNSNRSEHGSAHGRRGPEVNIREASEDRERGSRSKSVHHARSKSRHRSRHRSDYRSKSRRRFEEDDYDEEDDGHHHHRHGSGAIRGPLGLALTPRDNFEGHGDRRERDIKHQIRDLEEEKRRLREDLRHEEDDEGVRVEKDRRGRLSLVRPA